MFLIDLTIDKNLDERSENQNLHGVYEIKT